MRRFLSNAAMSFILIAGFLVWEVHRRSELGTLTGTRKGLYIAGAVLAAALGLAGMKERHRHSTNYGEPPKPVENPKRRQE